MAQRFLKDIVSTFEVLDKAKNAGFITFGYAVAADLALPMVKRRNPKTGRPKGFPDYGQFAQEIGYEGENISGIIKITQYNIPYQTEEAYNSQYTKDRELANAIRAEFGLEPLKNKTYTEQDKETGEHGIKRYNGNDDEKKGHTYKRLYIKGGNVKSMYYTVGSNGEIEQPITPDRIKNYKKKPQGIQGVSELRKLGVDDARIQEFIKRMMETFNGGRIGGLSFLYDHILYIVATIDGNKYVYVNNKLDLPLGGDSDIIVDNNDLIAIAKEKYADALRESNMHILKSYIKNLINETVLEIRNGKQLQF